MIFPHLVFGLMLGIVAFVLLLPYSIIAAFLAYPLAGSVGILLSAIGVSLWRRL